MKSLGKGISKPGVDPVVTMELALLIIKLKCNFTISIDTASVNLQAEIGTDGTDTLHKAHSIPRIFNEINPESRNY